MSYILRLVPIYICIHPYIVHITYAHDDDDDRHAKPSSSGPPRIIIIVGFVWKKHYTTIDRQLSILYIIAIMETENEIILSFTGSFGKNDSNV